MQPGGAALPSLFPGDKCFPSGEGEALGGAGSVEVALSSPLTAFREVRRVQCS